MIEMSHDIWPILIKFIVESVRYTFLSTILQYILGLQRPKLAFPDHDDHDLENLTSIFTKTE